VYCNDDDVLCMMHLGWYMAYGYDDVVCCMMHGV